MLITGTAGFIGYHLAARLLKDGHEILGLDALTPYYDVSLKLARQAILETDQRFSAQALRIEDMAAI